MIEWIAGGLSVAGFFFTLCLVLFRRVPADAAGKPILKYRVLVVIALIVAFFSTCKTGFMAWNEYTYAKYILIRKQLRQKEHLVSELFAQGTIGSDWDEMYLHPDLYQIVVKSRVVTEWTCGGIYEFIEPRARPSKERQQVLAELEKILMDETTHAGVLPVEVSENNSAIPSSAVATNHADKDKVDKAGIAFSETGFDDSDEERIREYQQTVRRVVRILYQHAELPPYFVRKVEEAIETGIVHWNNPELELQENFRWLALSIGGHDIFHHELVKRKLVIIEPYPTHRTETETFEVNTNFRVSHYYLREILDGKEQAKLPDDEKVVIRQSALPDQNLPLRLQMRQVLRALFSASSTPDVLTCDLIEQTIGIPLAGTVENPPVR